MTELSDIEVAQVSGGIVPLVIGGLVLANAFIWGAVAGRELCRNGLAC